MYQPVPVPLEILEFWLKKEKPNATEEEIYQYLIKGPYTKKEVDKYMASQERKESVFYKKFLPKK